MPLHPTRPDNASDKRSFLRSRTLRVDILSAFIGLLLVTVLTIAAFTHQRNRQAILHLSASLIEQTADATLRQASSYLEPAAAMVELVTINRRFGMLQRAMMTLRNDIDKRLIDRIGSSR